MISNTAEYALRAAVELAQKPDLPVTTEVLATATKVPVPYLYKILRTLAKAHLLKINRGRHGGFMLARPPAEIHLLEIVDAINPITRIDHCPLGLRKHSHELCPLHKRLDLAIQSIQEQFRNTSLADLMRDAGGSTLCLPDPDMPNTFVV